MISPTLPMVSTNHRPISTRLPASRIGLGPKLASKLAMQSSATAVYTSHVVAPLVGQSFGTTTSVSTQLQPKIAIAPQRLYNVVRSTDRGAVGSALPIEAPINYLSDALVQGAQLAPRLARGSGVSLAHAAAHARVPSNMILHGSPRLSRRVSSAVLLSAARRASTRIGSRRVSSADIVKLAASSSDLRRRSSERDVQRGMHCRTLTPTMGGLWPAPPSVERTLNDDALARLRTLARAVFRRLDADRSGRLSTEEASAAFGNDEEQWAFILEEADDVRLSSARALCEAPACLVLALALAPSICRSGDCALVVRCVSPLHLTRSRPASVGLLRSSAPRTNSSLLPLHYITCESLSPFNLLPLPSS